MYSAYKLNKQGDSIQPWQTPFPIWNQSVVPCPVLTVASWPPYRFLRRLVRWSGIPISFRIFQFVVVHTVKGFDIVNKAETDVFLREGNMATHSSTLTWKIPWTEEPGRLQSMGSRRVGQDWATSLSFSLFIFMHWRRTWQPTPVFLPGESQGWQSQMGCHLWGCTESDMTEAT